MTKFNKEDFSYHGGYLMYEGDAGRFNQYFEQPCHPTREGMVKPLFVARFKYSAKDKGRFLTFLIKNFTAEEFFAACNTENPENAFKNTFAPATVLEAKGYISATTRSQMKQQGYTVFNKETYRDYMNTYVFTSTEGHEEYWARVDREHAAILEACAAA